MQPTPPPALVRPRRMKSRKQSRTLRLAAVHFPTQSPGRSHGGGHDCSPPRRLRCTSLLVLRAAMLRLISRTVRPGFSGAVRATTGRMQLLRPATRALATTIVDPADELFEHGDLKEDVFNALYDRDQAALSDRAKKNPNASAADPPIHIFGKSGRYAMDLYRVAYERGTLFRVYTDAKVRARARACACARARFLHRASICDTRRAVRHAIAALLPGAHRVRSCTRAELCQPGVRQPRRCLPGGQRGQARPRGVV